MKLLKDTCRLSFEPSCRGAFFSFNIRWVLLIVLAISLQSTVHAQKQHLGGKKIKDQTLKLSDYTLNVGDSITLGAGTDYTKAFLYIYNVAGSPLLGSRPTLLPASMVNEKLPIDHFRHIKNRNGEAYIVVLRYGELLYQCIDFKKAVAQGEIVMSETENGETGK